MSDLDCLTPFWKGCTRFQCYGHNAECPASISCSKQVYLIVSRCCYTGKYCSYWLSDLDLGVTKQNAWKS